MSDMLRRPAGAHDPLHDPLSERGDSSRPREAGQLERSEAFEARLREIAEELRRAEAEFDGCAFSTSHCLRSPLGSILNFVAILQEEYGGRLDDQGREWLGRVAHNARAAVSMLDALLAFARVGRHPLTLESCEVGVIVRDVVRDQRALMLAQTAVELGELPICRADRVLLRVVLTELVSNAFKFSCGVAAPRVELDGREEEEAFVYRVRDNGVGFAMQDAQNLFGTFKRLQSSQDGHGMGLAVARRAVMRHGGRIWAEATPGCGACFSFSLPKSPKGIGA